MFSLDSRLRKAALHGDAVLCTDLRAREAKQAAMDVINEISGLTNKRSVNV